MYNGFTKVLLLLKKNYTQQAAAQFLLLYHIIVGLEGVESTCILLLLSKKMSNWG
jgi:hypothetical protein